MDQGKLDQLLGKVMGDFAGGVNMMLVRIGEQTGLFRALAEGTATSGELAKRSGTAERYVREWLSAMAAAGYVTYNGDGRFSMAPEQVAVFAVEDTPAYMPAFTDTFVSMVHDEPKVTNAFRSGKGIPWGDRHQCLFCGTERFFRPGYAAFLVDQWLPALEGVVEKLKAGAKVADIGCGHGSSTILMAKAFPKSNFTGFDFHPSSVEAARAHAKEAGINNATFEVAAAKSYPGRDYDLVAIFDALHDMGDPVGAARHVCATLRPGGTFMVVEPLAGDRLEDNLHTLGALFYGASTMICTPASLAQEVGLALGAQAGEAKLAGVLKEGGFKQVRRAAQTLTNLVLEARALS